MIYSSKFIQDKYGYNRVTSSYINGAVYDVSIIVCLSTGLVLVKTILYTVHTAKTLTFFFNLLFNQRFVIFGLTDGNVILIYSPNENNLNVSKNRKIMHFFYFSIILQCRTDLEEEQSQQLWVPLSLFPLLSPLRFSSCLPWFWPFVLGPSTLLLLYVSKYLQL